MQFPTIWKTFQKSKVSKWLSKLWIENSYYLNIIVPKERENIQFNNISQERDSTEMVWVGKSNKNILKVDAETLKSEESVSSEEDSDKSLIIQEESKAKKNFFQMVGSLLGLNRNRPSEIIEHNININDVEVKDFVLSKYELDRTPIPLLKNFFVHEIDPDASTDIVKTQNVKSSNVSSLTRDLDRNGCCSQCTIF